MSGDLGIWRALAEAERLSFINLSASLTEWAGARGAESSYIGAELSSFARTCASIATFVAQRRIGGGRLRRIGAGYPYGVSESFTKASVLRWLVPMNACGNNVLRVWHGNCFIPTRDPRQFDRWKVSRASTRRRHMAIMFRGKLYQAVLAAGVLAVGMCLAAPAAYAGPISISASIGGVPTGTSYENFDLVPLGSGTFTTASEVTVSFTGGAAAVQASVGGQYAAPFLSNSNGALFGDPTNGQDATTYLTTGTGTVTLQFSSEMKYLGLLWGSVDTYNWLDFYNGSTLIGTVHGIDVTASANGDQGASGTFYVNINSILGFDHVVAHSSSNAFEFDNVAFSPSSPFRVPEPGELGMFLFGLLLAGTGVWYRKRKMI